MSCSITTHERSISTQVLEVSNMVSNKDKTMLVLSLRPGSILGFFVTDTIMKKENNQRIKRGNIKNIQ
jgi:hypothetical protein